jgi:hypothetical protein
MIATHVSRPIRSASASGPIGCAKPSFAIVSIASARRRPPSARTRLVDERHQDPVRDEAGEVVRLRGHLAELLAERVIAAAVSSEVWTARITSTSFSTGTGLKKCIPITRSGRSVTAASDVIGIEDVFEARTRLGQQPSARRKSPPSRGVLDHRLDQQVGRHEVRRPR